MTDLSATLARLPALLALAEAAGLIKTSAGDSVAQIVRDLSPLASVAGGGPITPATLAAVETLLKDLHVQGLIQGSIIDDAMKSVAVAKAYASGQVALIDSNFDVLGVPGDVFAISKASTNEAAVAFRAAVGL